MVSHVCTKEREIDKLSKAVYGNGEDGLVQHTSQILERTTTLQNDMNAMKTDVKDLLTTIHALQMFKNEIQTEEKIKDKSSASWWQTVSVIIGIGGVAAAFIAIFLK